LDVIKQVDQSLNSNLKHNELVDPINLNDAEIPKNSSDYFLKSKGVGLSETSSPRSEVDEKIKEPEREEEEKLEKDFDKSIEINKTISNETHE
jgi:hypothetical protein